MKDIMQIWKASKEFSTPLLIKDHFESTFINHVDIHNLLKNISRDEENYKHSSVRVYVNGGLNPKFEDQVKFSTVSDFPTIEAWALSVFKEQNFGIIVNRAERWNADLALKIQECMYPITSAFDGRYELEVTLFIGNYGYTPFGFHIDDEDTSVVHFHLGPGNKSMYLLDRDTFESNKTGLSNRCFDYGKLQPLSKMFSIKEGDLFVLPAHLFHLGYTPDFSVGVALAVIDKEVDGKMQDTIRSNFDIFLSSDSDLSISEFKSFISKRQDSLRKSNGYFQLPPAIQHIPHINPDAKIKTSLYYPVVYYKNRNLLYVFARGNEIKMNYSSHIHRMLDKLTSYKDFTLNNMVELFKVDVSEDAVIKIIKTLIEFGALEIDE